MVVVATVVILQRPPPPPPQKPHTPWLRQCGGGAGVVMHRVEVAGLVAAAAIAVVGRFKKQESW